MTFSVPDNPNFPSRRREWALFFVCALVFALLVLAVSLLVVVLA